MAEYKRSKWKPSPGQPGPYEAIVVSHLDPKYMGTLQVEILRKADSGNDPERTGQLVEAKYLSPFYGTTPLGATTGDPGYQNSQKSYGMWMVPPDVGAKVLVMFAEGNFANAYWIGCIMDEFMNWMTPGYPATENLEDFGKKAPAAEYNKRRESGAARQPTKFVKPVHIDLTSVLVKQGLIDDDIRGVTSSSARREIPSSVFGISTPGPVDKRTNSVKFDKGPFGAKSNQFINRLGGSSFVMDDGDDKIIRKGSPKDSPPEYENLEALADGEVPTGDTSLPANELFRLKTRTGHQILLHNTEDLIYIGNARGTSWIELTSNGKIDIYAQDSVSIHSSSDLNFTADRDVNFTAGENVNFMVGKDVRTTAGDAIHNTAGTDINNTAGQNVSEIAGTYISNYAGRDASYQSFRNTVFATGKNLEIGAGGNLNIESSAHMHLTSENDAKLEVKNGSLALPINGDVELKTKNFNLDNETVSIDAEKFILDSTTLINMSADIFAVNSTTSTEVNSDGQFTSLSGELWSAQSSTGGMQLVALESSMYLRADRSINQWAKDGDIAAFGGNGMRLDTAGYAALTAIGSISIKSINDNDPSTQGTMSAEIRGGVAIQSGAGIDLLAIGSLGDENASGAIKIEAFGDLTTRAAKKHIADAGEAYQVRGSKNLEFQAGEQFLVKATNEIQMKGSKTELQPSAAPAVNITEVAAATQSVAGIAGLNNYKPFNSLASSITGNTAPEGPQGIEAAKQMLPFVGRVQWHRYDRAGLSIKPVYADRTDLPPVFAVDPTPAVYADRVARMPMHEPWYQHENLDPLQFTPEKTRAGSELPDVYNPQIPDTFATSPVKQSDIGTKSVSVTFDPETLILGAGDEYTWGSNRDTWVDIALQFNIQQTLATAVYAVIVSQYGSWDYNNTEAIPVTQGEDPEQVAQLIRKRYPSVQEWEDSDLLKLAESGENDFFSTVYGYNTEYGKAIGNTIKNDALDFRGHGPYLGIVGKGIFRKLQRFINSNHGIEIESNLSNPFNLNSFGHNLILSAWVYNHYKDHGRGMLGNVRIMLFGTEDYELMHPRDVKIYTDNYDINSTRTRDNN